MNGTGEPIHPVGSRTPAGPGDEARGDEGTIERLLEAAVEAELATGERESTEEKARRHILVRLAVIVAGTFVTLAGLLMLIAPGPGIVVVIAGLGILSTEVSWAERMLAYAKEKARVDEVTAQRPWIKPVSIAATVIAVVVSTAFAVVSLTGD